MRFNFFKVLKQGNFVNFYLANYTNENGEEKDYEIVSRRMVRTKDELFKKRADAVSMIVYSPDNERILLQKEFRLSVNQWVWSFPAGLIDEGETAEESARRELSEETGLTMTDVILVGDPCYTSVGLSNEMIVPIYCHAEGTFKKSSSAMEEIEPQWFTKDELRKLLEQIKKDRDAGLDYISFTNRASAEVYHWLGIV